MTARVDVDSGMLCIIDPAYLRESHGIDGGPSEWYITTTGKPKTRVNCPGL